MEWLPSQANCTRPAAGWLKENVQALLNPLRPVAGIPLTSKSGASMPVTASLKVTVTCVRLLTVPGAGVNARTAGRGGAGFPRAAPRKAAATSMRQTTFTTVAIGSAVHTPSGGLMEYENNRF